MQKAVRYEESQLLQLATRAKTDHMIAGTLQKKSSDTVKWKQRFFALFFHIFLKVDCRLSRSRPVAVHGIVISQPSYFASTCTLLGLEFYTGPQTPGQ